MIRWPGAALALFAATCAASACTVDPDGFSGRRPRRMPAATGMGSQDPNAAEEPTTYAPPVRRTAEATFTASDDNFPNPERGFFQEYDDFLATTDVTMAATESADTRLIMAIVRLDQYRAGPLPPSLLQNLGQAFGLLRRHGLKAILRFSYNAPTDLDYRTAVDSSLEHVRQHVAQVKPTLQANADVIAFWQAGFIGAWGEWHTSSNNLANADAKQAVRDSLLDALPAGRTLQIRYAADVMTWFPATMTEDAMPASSGPAVFGLHNDCFLSSTSDVATYDPNPAIAERQRSYVRAMTAVTPFGGETCNPPAEQLMQMRSRCADVLTEAQEYHLTYLNRDYFTPAFQDKWMVEGCYNTVAAQMGYRFQLVSAAHPPTGARGERFTLRLTVRNVGWARLINPRPLHIVLRHRVTGRFIDKIVDAVEPRAWLPGGKPVTLSAAIEVPGDADGGDYDVFIGLPDLEPLLTADPRYAVRWANADDIALSQSWEPARGRFRLGTTFEVK
jgi:hypothetical protein